MTRKKLTLIALGWTSCTAAAFWAGMAWKGQSPATTTAGKTNIAGVGMDHTAAAGAGAAVTAGEGQDKSPLARKAIRDLTLEETTARMKDILAMEDPLERMEAYLAFIKGVQGKEQLTAAMEALTEGYNNRERGKEFGMLMTRWAKEDPESALAWTQTKDDWRKQWGPQTALSLWAQTNPQKALEWAAAHPPGNKDEGNFHMAAVIAGAAKTDLDLASQMAQNMDRSEARGQAMERVLEQLFKQRGGEAAKTAIMALPEGPYKNGILGRLAERLADTDAASAAQWAAALPEGEAKPRVVTEVVDEWAERNPNDAGVWLNGLPQSPALDEPRERFAWKVQEQDPEAALAWAGSITDERRRNETSSRLIRDWMNREPEIARAWVGTSQLPDDMKERLLRRGRRG